MSPTDDAHDDRALAASARLGTAAAWQRIADRYCLELVRFLTRLGGDPDLAEEAAQQAFLVALSRRDRLADERPLRLWLFALGRDQLRTIRRRQWRRRTLSLDRLLALGAIDPTAPPDRPPLGDRTQRALGALDRTAREALLLRELAGFSDREIARLQGDSLAAVRKRLWRARRRFARRYTDG